MAFLSREFKNLQWYGMTEGIPVISMVTGIFLPSFFEKNLIFTLIGFLAGNTATGHSVHAALFRSASVPYGLPCRYSNFLLSPYFDQ